MKTAAVMLAQLYQEQKKELDKCLKQGKQSGLMNNFEEIKSKIIKEMMSLEDERLEELSKLNFEPEAVEEFMSKQAREFLKLHGRADKEDPSCVSLY
jgi:hypothetical protein